MAATALEEGMDSSGSPGPSAPHADAFEEPMDTTSDGDAQDVTDEARAFDEGTREAMTPSMCMRPARADHAARPRR